MKKLRKEQWISFGLFICVLGIVAGCTAFRHFAGAETPQGGGDLNVLAQSEGETQQVSPQVKKSLPRGAGAWLTAGVDFPVKSSAEKARSGIDSVLDRAAEYGAAVVFLDAIRSGEAVQAGSLDTLRYAIGSASAKGFQPVVCVPAADVIRIGKDGITLAPEVLSALCQNYQVEVLLLSGWRELSFEPWGAAVVEKQEALTNAVQQLRSAAEKAAPGIVFGVESSLVWSNEASGTKASYESLKNGFADIKGWMEKKLADFIYLSSASLTTDHNVPLETAAAWWNQAAVDTETALYMEHKVSSGLASEENGVLPDELAVQMGIVAKNRAFFGSVLDSISALEQAEYGENAFVKNYLTGGVEKVKKEAKLSILNYIDLKFTAKKDKLTFLGTSVPGTEITCNGQKVKQSPLWLLYISCQFKKKGKIPSCSAKGIRS